QPHGVTELVFHGAGTDLGGAAAAPWRAIGELNDAAVKADVRAAAIVSRLGGPNHGDPAGLSLASIGAAFHGGQAEMVAGKPSGIVDQSGGGCIQGHCID